MISGLLKRNIKGAIVAGALIIGGNSYAQLGLNWTEVGPNDLGGRCRSIVIDKTDATGKTLYAAGVSGGVFRSLNAGGSWAPVNDQAPSLIISCMTQATDGTIYLGTGESFSRGGNGAGQSGFIGTGLYKFTPGSSNITLVMDSATFGNINEIAIDPANSNIYIASQKGFFVSTNGGGAFTENAITSVSNTPAMDVKVAADGGVYVAVGSKSSTNSKVYYCATGGNGTYADITPTLPSSFTYGRIEIATAPTDANYVYVSIAKQFSNNTGGGLAGVFVSGNKGASWNVITYGTSQLDPLSLGSSGYGDYSHTLIADPINAKTIYLGGQVLMKWTQNPSLTLGQGTWTQIGIDIPLSFAIYIHPKIHDLRFDAAQNCMFIATDGGIYKSTSTNEGVGFLAVNNGFNITQFNSVAYQTMATSSSTAAANFVGVSGGAIGNDLVYIPGDLNTPQGSKSFGSTDAYQADFSKILPVASFHTGRFGSLYRTNNIKITNPVDFTDPHYDLAATGGPGSSSFGNENTPGRLWENYGGGTTDSALFYNPQIKTSFVNSSTTATKFTVTNQRPQKSARYQVITITAVSTKSAMPIPANQTITIYPKYEGPRKISGYTITGSANTSTSTNNYISSNDSSLVDNITFTFASAPKDSSTITVKMDLYYVPGPDTVNNTVKTTTLSTTQYWTTLKRPSRNGKYLQVTAIDPTNSQTITINPVYSGTAITSYVVSGTSNTVNCIVKLNPSKLYSAQDTIKFDFSTAPVGSNMTLSVSTLFDTKDSIVVRYDDISGMPYTTGEPITTVFTSTTTNSNSSLPLKKIALPFSARYAVGVGGTNPAVYVVKRPLNFGINPHFVKIAGKNSRPDSAAGMPYKAATGTAPLKGTVTRLEWAPNGTCLYVATARTSGTLTSYFLYRVSHLEFVGDSAAADYSGRFTSDIDSGNTYRRLPKQRLTPIAKFSYPITSISVKPDNTNILVTLGSYTNTSSTVFESTGSAATLNLDSAGTSNFAPKNGTGLPNIPAYASLYEMTDNKRVLIGTEQGLYSTLDITQSTPVWVKENNNQLPNVPVFQIRQQTLPNWLAKNSGIIYVATHGRGIWSTDKYYTPYAIGVEEISNKPTFGTNMVLYPNPASSLVNLWFIAKGDASYQVNVYDINGRTVLSENMGNLAEGEHTLPLNTGALTNGVYFISIHGTNNFNATSKLIITK